MKKEFAGATAILVLSTVAHAQSSVELYGVIDSGLLYQNTSAASHSGAETRTGRGGFQYWDGGLYSSSWGMRGTEDLGGGYSVRFKLQGAFNSGTGKSGLTDTVGGAGVFNQITTIGVAGPFGSLDIGRQIAPMTFAMSDTDVRRSSNFGSIRTAWNSLNYAAGFSGSTTNKIVGGLFESNAIVYRSPSVGGASIALQYDPGGTSGSPTAGSRESAVLQYSRNGLNLAALYYQGHDTTGTTSPNVVDNRYYYLGAKYTIHDFSVSASFSRGGNPAHSDLYSYDLYSMGVAYRFSPMLDFSIGVYHIKDNNFSANKSTAYAAGVDYKLSKTTTLYAQGGYVDNAGTMNQEIAYTAAVAPGKKTLAADIGIRHAF